MELFDAKLDSYELRILDISDTIGQSLVRHEYVNTDGADIQNMGLRAREISFRAFFYGLAPVLSTEGTIEAIYPYHVDFINSISDTTTTHILNHPKYGVIEGYVESATIVHDDTQDYVAIDIKFVEDGLLFPGAFVAEESLPALMDKLYLAMANNEITNGVPDELSANGFAELVGKSVDFTQSLSSQFTKVTAPIRNFLRDTDTVLNTLDTFLDTVTEPVNTINASINLVNDIPSRLVGSINSAANRLVGSLSDLSNTPVNFINSMIYNLDALKATVTGDNASFFTSHMTKIWSASIARQAGILYDQDDKAYSTYIAQEKKQIWGKNGRYRGTISTPYFMSIADIEQLAYNVRVQLQTAVTLDRTDMNLKQMGEDINFYIDEIKLEKRRVITVNINQMPLHVLCMTMGLDYHRAERIMDLNPSILNPTFTAGAIQVYGK